MDSSQGDVETRNLEKMESSFPAGFPYKVDFSESGQAYFDAWKESCKKISMESSPVMFVQGIQGLDLTRSLKMYRNKARKRSSVWDRMESSPVETASKVWSKEASSTKVECPTLEFGAVEGVAALHSSSVSSDSSL